MTVLECFCLVVLLYLKTSSYVAFRMLFDFVFDYMLAKTSNYHCQSQGQSQNEYISQGPASFHDTNQVISLLRSVESVHGRPGPVNRHSCLVH